MAKIKLTKTELKAQSDALKRFQRFLPMLQLKKQQLQAEISAIGARIDEVAAKESAVHSQSAAWVALFSGEAPDTLAGLVTLKRVVTDTSNIAGVSIPVFHGIETDAAELDLFATPAWFDDAAALVKTLLALKAERGVLEEQRTLVIRELNTTSQRVNLFEKVKIPECKENIRVIKIAIGDEQTASVTRGKIAKGRSKKPANEVEAA
ncbi:MAG: V-type ATP synthase subunit D [Verrucomicrobiota bacterium]|jgi:V/A-type H+-transporting ATPase subunit D|nr:V-type ATP synthase subunit D [Verrucomicrobiota bacterium]